MKKRLGTESLDENSILNNRKRYFVYPEFVRVWVYTEWKRIYLQDGSYNFTETDKHLTYNKFYKKIWLAYRHPKFVETNSTEFINLFSDYCYKVIERYPDLYAIELWNEPHPKWQENYPDYLPFINTWDDFVSLYTEMVIKTYEKIRKINSIVKLLGPSFYGLSFEKELEMLKLTGAINKLDGISLHDYMGKVVYLGSDPHYLDGEHLSYPPDEQLRRINKIIPKPIYITECGIYNTKQAIQYAAAYLSNPYVKMVLPHVLFVDSSIAGVEHELHGYTCRGWPKTKTLMFLRAFKNWENKD